MAVTSIDQALSEAQLGVAVGTPARPEIVAALLLHIEVLEDAVDRYVTPEQMVEFFFIRAALNNEKGNN